MKFNRAKMDKMRNDIARNAKMKIQNSTDAECCESPVSRKHYKSGGGWAGK